MSNIGEKIQNLRKARGMTQKELATFLGYSESFISYIEKNERKLTINDLHKIATIFAVDIDFFISKPKITHFRAKININDNADYSKMMDDFRDYIDKNL